LSFWDEYKELGGSYINADEKKVIMDNGIPLRVVAVIQEETNQFNQPRFVLQVIVPNPETGEDETRKLAFPYGSGAESRDRMLAGMMEYLGANDGEEIAVKLEKQGRAYFLRQA